MANVTITQLPQAGPILGTESVPIVQNGQTVQTTTAAIAASPSQTYQYLTVIQTPNLPNSRYLSAGSGLLLTDNGAQSTYTISLGSTLSSFNSALAGVMVKTDSSTVINRFMSASGAGITVTNGDGVAGNPTYSLTGNVASLANTTGNGMLTFINGFGVQPVTITGTASEIDVANGTGVSGAPTIGISDNPILPGTGAVTVPHGTSAQQPSGANGQIRYNTDTNTFDGYASGAWRTFALTGGVTTFSAGTTGLTPIPPASGAITLGGTLITSNGGTGLSSYTAGDLTYYASGTALTKLAIGTVNYVLTSTGSAPQWTAPSSVVIGTATNLAGGAAGSVPYQSGAGTTTFLALGTSTHILTAGASAPQYTDPATITVGTSTNLAGGAANRIAYQTGSGATTFMVAPTVANTYLEWSGSAFQWSSNPLGTVTSVDVSGGTTGLTTSGGPVTSSGTITLAGTLITTNGGTGLSSYTAGDTLYYASSTALSKLAIGSSTYIMTSTGSAPQWSDPAGVTVGNATNATTATNATNVATTATSTNATYYPTFVDATTGNNAIEVDTDLTYNPSTNTLTAPNIVATSGISGGTF